MIHVYICSSIAYKCQLARAIIAPNDQTAKKEVLKRIKPTKKTLIFLFIVSTKPKTPPTGKVRFQQGIIIIIMRRLTRHVSVIRMTNRGRIYNAF